MESMATEPVTTKTKIVIDRSKWRTGRKKLTVATGKGETLLCNSEGYMCCLGFICKAGGVPPERLSTGEPEYLYSTYESLQEAQKEVILVPDITYLEDDADGLFHNQTSYAEEAIVINDDEDMSLADKEAKLLALFKDSCYELEFVGEPTPYSADT